MDRRIYYLVVLILCVLSLLVGVLWIYPRTSQLGEMYLESQQYDAAFELFNQEIEKGNYAPWAVMPLVQIYINQARDDLALDLMEKYVERNPDSDEAWTYLAKMYQDSGEWEKYETALKQIYRLKPSKDILEELLLDYMHQANVNKQIETLELMVKDYKANESEYVNLAELYDLTGEKEKALAILGSMSHRFNIKDLELGDVKTVVRVYAVNGDEEKANLIAREYAKEHPTTRVVIGLISSLNNARLFEDSYALLDFLPKQLRNKPPVLDTEINLLFDMKLNQKAYEYLKNQFAIGKLPNYLNYKLIELSVQYDDREFLKEVLGKTDLKQLQNITLLNLVGESLEKHDPEIAAIIRARIGSNYLRKHPVLGYGLEIAMNQWTEEQAAKYVSKINLDSLNNQQRVELAQIYSNAGYDDLVKKVLEKVTSLRGVDVTLLYGTASLFVQTQMAKKGITLFEDLQKVFPPNTESVYTPWLLLEAADGNGPVVEEWIARNPKVDENIWRDAINASYANKHYELALSLVQKLDAHNDSDKNQALLAKTLAANHRYGEALIILHHLQEKGLEIDDTLIPVLGAMVKEQPAFAAELQEVMNKFLNSQNTTIVAKRDVGYNLIDLGLKQEAVPIFLNLSKGEKFDGDDTQTLLQLWGERPPREGLRWIAAKATDAQAAEKAKWIRYLVDINQGEIAYGLIQEGDLENEDIAEAYFEVLTVLKRKRDVEQFANWIVCRIKNPVKLRSLGKVAQDAGYLTAAEIIYEHLLEVVPGDAFGLKQLGIVSLFKGYFAAADYYLGTYLRTYDGDYEGYFYYAETLRASRHPQQANPFYIVALAKIATIEKPELNARLMQASALAVLSYRIEAYDLYATLLRENPEVMAVRTDFAIFLLNNEYFDRAKEVLWSAPEFPKNKYTDDDKKALLAAQIRYFREFMRLGDSEALAGMAVSEYPDSAYLISNYGETQQVQQKWRQAADLYAEAMYLEPENETYPRMRRELMYPYLSHVYFETEYRDIGQLRGQLQQDLYTRGGLVLRAQNGDKFEVFMERDRVWADDYIHPFTGVTGSIFKRRYRGEISYQHDFYNGDATYVGLFVAPYYWGARGWYKLNDHSGWTALELEYHRPDWGQIDSEVDRGTRNKIIFTRFQRIVNRCEGFLSGAYNQYNLFINRLYGQTYQFEGNLTYTFSPENNLVKALAPDMTIGWQYILDSEIVIHQKMRRGIDGLKFSPLSLVSRQNNSAILFFNKRFSSDWRMGAYAGYLYNTIGQLGAPIGQFELSWGKLDGLYFLFRYTRTVNVQGNSAPEDLYTGRINYSF